MTSGAWKDTLELKQQRMWETRIVISISWSIYIPVESRHLTWQYFLHRNAETLYCS